MDNFTFGPKDIANIARNLHEELEMTIPIDEFTGVVQQVVEDFNKNNYDVTKLRSASHVTVADFIKFLLSCDPNAELTVDEYRNSDIHQTFSKLRVSISTDTWSDEYPVDLSYINIKDIRG